MRASTRARTGIKSAGRLARLAEVVESTGTDSAADQVSAVNPMVNGALAGVESATKRDDNGSGIRIGTSKAGCVSSGVVGHLVNGLIEQGG